MAKPMAMALDLFGRFVYVANSGSNNISAYRIGESGALTPVAGSPFPAGDFPASVAVSP
jgi:6-phosphogluconolactonase